MSDNYNPVLNFENLYNNAGCGLIVFHADGSIIKVNKTLLKWLGTNEEDLLKTNFKDLLDKGGLFYYELLVLPLLRLHNEVKEISLEIKTGSGHFPCLFSAGVLKVENSNDNLVYGTLFKVIDRKKYENELLTKRIEAEEQKQQKADMLKEIAFDQSHLVRAPVANILGLLSLLEIDKLDEDVKNIIGLIQSSAEKLDAEVKNVVDKTYRKSKH